MKPIDQLQLFAKCLYEPDDVVEIRLIRSERRHIASLWTPASGFVKAAICQGERYNKSHDMYAGANPRKAENCRDAKGVALARCVFVEWDGLTIAQAAERIDSKSLPIPTCVVWSGGGVHVYWRLTSPIIDLDLWRTLQKQMIQLLDSDKTICDPPRIMRLPGFFNHKPHRSNSWLVYADPSNRVSAVDLAEKCPPLPSYQKTTNAVTCNCAMPIRTRYVDIVFDRECQKLSMTPEGTRHHQLMHSSFKVGKLVGAGLLDHDVAMSGLLSATRSWGSSEAIEVKKIKAGLTAGSQNPWQQVYSRKSA